MKRSKTATRLAVVAGGVAATLVLAATPAWAASVSRELRVGSILLGSGGVYNDGYTFWACDSRANGVTVTTEVQLNNGYTDSVGDPNGSQDGCGRKNTPGQYYAVQYRVCERSTCTSWARAY